MKQIPVTDLRPGMVTAEDILTYDLKMIVPKGVVLTENIISRLESYSVYYVHIEDTVVNELNTPMTLSKVLDADAGWLLCSSFSTSPSNSAFSSSIFSRISTDVQNISAII